MSFEPARAKLTIGSIDDPGLTVSAQYNPKELGVEQAVPWKKQEPANNSGAAQGGTGGGGSGGGNAGGSKEPDNRMAIEFVGAEGRTMTVELLFDGYEGPQSGRYTNVTGQVALLQKMCTVIDSGSSKEEKRRPHHCVVSWGQRGLPKFECVIESLSTKYSMFSSDGEPLRATCTVKLKEAKIVDKEKKS